MSKLNIWFIINPYSGSKKDSQQIIQLIDNQLDKEKYSYQIILTTYAGEATKIATEASKKNIDAVVAVGGDGTVNEIAKALIHSETALAILPCGSGNGLARDLGISLNLKQAIQGLNQAVVLSIDAGVINDIPFFCTAGIGFDAACAKAFAEKGGSRGLMNYIKVGFNQFWKYKPVVCEFGGNNYELFSLTFANARQFGNDATIAPLAELNNGYLDCTLVSKISTLEAIPLLLKLFTKTIHKDSHVEMYRATNLTIQGNENFLIHYDGESQQLNTNRLTVNVLPKVLKVLQ